MVNIPIPAGCTYDGKSKYNYNETHREYYKNEVAIFCNLLMPGTYKFEVDLITNYIGSLALSPASVELMYYPTIKANEQLKRVITIY